KFCLLQDPEPISALLARYSLSPNFLLFVGDIHPRRNVGTIIRALHELKAANTAFHDLELLVIGRALVELPAAWKQPGVRYLGYIPDSDLRLLYNAARALVYPSFYEGFGFPVLEAMACGCPVIVSRGTACEEVAGGAGLKVDPASVQSVAEAISALMQNRDLAGRCAETGLARAAGFDWRTTAKQTLQVYMNVLGRL